MKNGSIADFHIDDIDPFLWQIKDHWVISWSQYFGVPYQRVMITVSAHLTDELSTAEMVWLDGCTIFHENADPALDQISPFAVLSAELVLRQAA